MEKVEFEYSSDEETVHDIAELEAALSLRNSLAPPSSGKAWVASQQKARPASIDIALQFNRAMDEMYMILEQDLSKRLNMCQKRLEIIQELLKDRNGFKYCSAKSFRFKQCGIPYFKDQNMFPSPLNKDAQTMKELNLFDYISLPPVTNWTAKDKHDFEKSMEVVSKNRLEKFYLSKIRVLERQMKTLKKDSEIQIKKAEVIELEKQISDISSMNLRELTRFVSDLDGDYDWEDVRFISRGRHNMYEYKAMWYQYMHPDINHDPWTKAEHTKLHTYARLYCMQNWDLIASELGTNRTAYQCFVYYKTNIVTNLGFKWSKEEDEYLKRIIEICRVGDYIPWAKVAFYFENRTKTQIYHRWHIHCLPEHKKGRFIKEEDDALLACIHKFGLDFNKAAKLMPHRTRTQLKARYYESLKNNKSAEWSIEEDRRLLQLVGLNANEIMNFASIAKFFPGKTRAHLRLRYLTLRKWIILNPIGDITEAPRRRARIKHNRRLVDLETALSALQKKLNPGETEEPEVDVKVTIDDLLINFFINELNDSKEWQPEESKTTVEKQNETTKDNNFIPEMKLSVLNNILLLLGANIDLESFCQSFEPDSALRKLTEFQSINHVIKNPKVQTVRTYSRAKKTETPSTEKIVQDAPISIWSNTSTLKYKYILPPNFATILALRKILLENMNESGRPRENIMIGFATLNKTLNMEYTSRWLPRFQMLFALPLIMSDTAPSSDHNFFDTADSTLTKALTDNATSPTYYYVPFDDQIKEGESRKKQKTDHKSTDSAIPSCSKDIDR